VTILLESVTAFPVHQHGQLVFITQSPWEDLQFFKSSSGFTRFGLVEFYRFMPIGAGKRRVSKDDRAKDVEVTLGLAAAEAGIASRPY
jgi:hypothetical protein